MSMHPLHALYGDVIHSKFILTSRYHPQQTDATKVMVTSVYNRILQCSKFQHRAQSSTK